MEIFLQIVGGLVAGYFLYMAIFDLEKKDIKLVSEKDRELALKGIHKGFVRGLKGGISGKAFSKKFATKFREAADQGKTLDKKLVHDICDELHGKNKATKPKLKIVEKPQPKPNEIFY
jgi:hypothetical protein